MSDATTWFGRTPIILTSAEADMSRDTVEKNFVEQPAEVFELNQNIEEESFNLIMNEALNPKGQSISEQRKMIRSMPYRIGHDFPVKVGADVGHFIPTSSTANITPSQEIEEGSMSGKFIEYPDYKPGFRINTRDSADVLNDTVNVIFGEVDDGSHNTSLNKGTRNSFEFSTADGQNYTYPVEIEKSLDSPELIYYDSIGETNFYTHEKISPVEIVKSNGEEIHTETGLSDGDYIQNNLIRATYYTNISERNSNIGLTGEAGFEYSIVFDSSYEPIGQLVLNNIDTPYPSDNSNYKVSLDCYGGSGNIDVEMYKFIPSLRIQNTTEEIIRFYFEGSNTEEKNRSWGTQRYFDSLTTDIFFTVNSENSSVSGYLLGDSVEIDHGSNPDEKIDIGTEYTSDNLSELDLFKSFYAMDDYKPVFVS